MTSPSLSRDGADRCPGLLTPFISADGAMVRLRLPGGRVAAAVLAEITSLAGRFGDPRVTLTSRASVQLRGLPDPLPRELIAAIDDLGLVPSAAHDKARNIVADPDPTLDDLVQALDDALLADHRLAELPGRFLLAAAQPGGPVLGEPWDIAIEDEGDTARVLVDGRSRCVPREEAAQTALSVARAFLGLRDDATTWNVRNLAAATRADLLPGGTPFVSTAAEPPRPGPHGEDLIALAPLGLLTAEMAHLLSGSLRITPWRSIVIPGGARHAPELATAGFAVTPDSPWTVLTACAGARCCGRTTTPTRELALEAAPFVDRHGPPIHVIGCERACGRPARDHVTVLNPASPADIVAAQGSSPKKDS